MFILSSPLWLIIFIGIKISSRGPLFYKTERIGKNKEKFLSVRPGLTGYWASNGRSNTTYQERMEMELFYVEHCCIRFDLKIIWNTIVTVIKRDGAK